MDPDEGLYCPARTPETISVGVYEALCTNEVQLSGRGMNRPVHTADPPGSYRVPYAGDGTEEWAPTKRYCGGTKCFGSQSCETHRTEQLWAGNPSNEGDIDVFAPGTMVQVTADREPKMDIGTSFSAAIVSGALTAILGELHGSQPLPTTSEIKREFSQISSTVGSTQFRKFNSLELLHLLQR